MTRFETYLRSSSVPVITIIGLFAVVVGLGAVRKSGSTPRKQDKATPQIQSFSPRVHNLTSSFELTQARRSLDNDKAGPELSLRNGYTKNITAYAVSVNGLIGLVDCVYSENQDRRSVASGTVETRRFSYRRSGNREIAAREEFDIKILAVVFDDKTSEGDETAIAGILEQRRESKRIFKRVANLLNEVLSLNQTINHNAFDILKSRILSLSRSPDTGDLNDVLRWLDTADNSLSLKERITLVKGTCENLIDRL